MYTCSNCKVTKPITDFYKNVSHKLGHTTQCRICIKTKYIDVKKPEYASFICKKCKVEKSLDNFVNNNHNKYGHSIKCKQCTCRRKTPLKPKRTEEDKKRYVKEYIKSNKSNIKRYNNKKEFIDAFGGKCQKCGYRGCLAALEFHHKDPKIKEFSLTKLSRNKNSWEKFIEEAKKCILLCCRCHREEHYLHREKMYEAKFNAQKPSKEEQS